MRLWHIDLLPFLPKSQLLAQWRELNSIFKKQDKHILINYIYDYDKQYLWDYAMAVLQEFSARKFKISEKSKENFKAYFNDMENLCFKTKELHFKEHDKDYLTICYYNLMEKYLRGQKDFSAEIWEKLEKFYKEKTK